MYGGVLPTAIHSSSIISESAHLDTGTVVMAGANASIEKFSILNTGCPIDHDVDLGDGANLSRRAPRRTCSMR